MEASTSPPAHGQYILCRASKNVEWTCKISYSSNTDILQVAPLRITIIYYIFVQSKSVSVFHATQEVLLSPDSMLREDHMLLCSLTSPG